MFTAFARAFKTPDLRKKLLFTLGIIVLYRLGAHIPAPGVDYSKVQQCIDQADSGGLLGLMQMFSGGALLQITIFALGIMPYITASIILQLLTVVIPRLEALKKEGQSGTAKITQYTRYLTVALAVLQGTGLVATARSGALFQNCSVGGQIVPDKSIFTTVIMVITMTASTAAVMWLGELITDRGIGNGMSILMFISIAATFPGALWAIKESGKLADGWIEFGTVILVGFVMVGLVVFVEQAQRRIPVQYAKRMIGRRSYGGTSTYIPLKVNQAGVIPVIFASSLLYIPALIVQFSGSQARLGDLDPGQLRDRYAPVLHRDVLRADRLLRLLLRGHLVQPRRSRRQHEEVWWLHPGYPGRPTYCRVPELRAQQDHLAGLAVSGPDRSGADDGVGRLRRG